MGRESKRQCNNVMSPRAAAAAAAAKLTRRIAVVHDGFHHTAPQQSGSTGTKMADSLSGGHMGKYTCVRASSQVSIDR